MLPLWAGLFINHLPVVHHLTFFSKFEHLKALILAAELDMAALLTFLSQTAARIGEARSLRWTEVFLDREQPFAVLTTRKTSGGHAKKSPQPLTPTAVRAIESMRGRHKLWVFPGPRGRLLPQTAQKRMAALCEHAGVPSYSFHQIRHWAGTVAMRGAKNRKAVSNFLRHESTAITDVYLHAIDAELWEIAERLEQEMGTEEEAKTQIQACQP
jgi:integrase